MHKQDKQSRVNLSLCCFSINICLINLLISCSPKLSNGHYQGVELISVASDNRYWPGLFKPDTNIDIAKRQWYHKVTIYVNEKRAIITKEPFYIKNDSTYFSKTEGGFYYYSGDVKFNKDDNSFNISSRLDSCKFCPRLATAVPLYTHASYYIKKNKGEWIVNTNYEKNLTFEKK